MSNIIHRARHGYTCIYFNDLYAQDITDEQMQTAISTYAHCTDRLKIYFYGFTVAQRFLKSLKEKKNV